MSRLLSQSGRWRSVFHKLEPSHVVRQPIPIGSQRTFFQGSLLWNDGRYSYSPLSVPLTEEANEPSYHQACQQQQSLRSLDEPFYQQLRWKRNVGHRFQFKTRPPTKKQRKQYNRKIAKMKLVKGKQHGEPGSKAGSRRQTYEDLHKGILKMDIRDDTPAELENYGMGDLYLDSLMEGHREGQPTPIPHHLGDQQQQLFDKVKNQMEDFQRTLVPSSDTTNGEESTALVDTSSFELPSDKDISLALRSFRDRYGTKHNPIGLAKGISFLLQDLGVPMTAFGEYTYNALLSCARTPTEARKVMHLMKQHNQPITTISWAILVDVHAKMGDYEGCVEVHKEMAANGLAPTLATYTSLIAACYSVCSNYWQFSHKDRDKAAKVAWTSWQDMVVVGIEPDAMAYGALLRIIAIKGQPERALNILEEMAVKEVAPTTLCFTSALRSVARSHQSAIRFEKGHSRRKMRRSEIAAHHGKLAKNILILAENAQVDQDDGFVAALINCAGAAGDLATAKAIYVASQIRRLDQFRITGEDEYVDRITGHITEETEDEMLKIGAGNGATTANGLVDPNHQEPKLKSRTGLVAHRAAVKAFDERERGGKDPRVLSALALACSSAANQNGIGTMWQGRENDGYLCDNSLRLLKTPGKPEMQDRDIPEQEREEFWQDESEATEFSGRKLGRKHGQRHRGLIPDENAVDNVDDLEPEMQEMVLDEDGSKKDPFKKTTFDDIWKLKYGKDDQMRLDVREEKGYDLSLEDKVVVATADEIKFLPPKHERNKEMRFDKKKKRWIVPAEINPSLQSSLSPEPEPQLEQPDNPVSGSIPAGTESDNATGGEEERARVELGLDAFEGTPKLAADGELYYDTTEGRWKSEATGPASTSIHALGAVTDVVSKLSKESPPSDQDDNEFSSIDENEFESLIPGSTKPFDPSEEREFQEFLAHVKSGAGEVGLPAGDFDETEARAFFRVMNSDDDKEPDEKKEFDDLLQRFSEDPSGLRDELNQFEKEHLAAQSGEVNPPRDHDAGNYAHTAQMSAGQAGVKTLELPFPYYHGVEETQANDAANELDYLDKVDKIEQNAEPRALDAAAARRDVSVGHIDGDTTLPKQPAKSELEQLRLALPMFSDARLKRILEVFHTELGSPHLSDLALVVRERMPDYINNQWLKRMARLTGSYLMVEAERKGVASSAQFLNSILSMKASLGGLDDTVKFYQSEFRNRNLEPDGRSNRIMMQMFLKQDRFARAMAFKRMLEKEAKSVDHTTYGELVAYCANRRQLGTALLLLKECIRVHGAPPNEFQLNQLRYLLSENRMDRDRQILDMIGKDPMYYIKLGIADKKTRHKFKKGMPAVIMAGNATLRA